MIEWGINPSLLLPRDVSIFIFVIHRGRADMLNMEATGRERSYNIMRIVEPKHTEKAYNLLRHCIEGDQNLLRFSAKRVH